MDTDEILSTKPNEERCSEDHVLTGTKVNLEEAFPAVHKMMNDLLVPLQRRTVTLTNVDATVTYDITTTPPVTKKAKAVTNDYGDQLTGSVQDKCRGSDKKGKGKLFAGEDTRASQTVTEASLNSLLLSHELHGSSENETPQDEARNIPPSMQPSLQEDLVKYDSSHVSTTMNDWGPRPSDVLTDGSNRWV
ncbi:unnamed protein product [Arabis nemorensis]|uniref:Uncharacterized protein n=1 Tax=Arabis nemorensis TaxID=586526 RepID=A0A565AWS9_9BRAS|nr:unnamed protein product [Arabis nemorensis]